VALLVEGRRCLVVGGGNVAGRKAEALLDAGADVILVAPEIGEHAAGLAARPGITLVRREFVPADLDRGLFLAVTVTDDHALNRRILDACHARGLLCACPDTGWENGDFISPATFRHGDLTVSVSTGGASCRRSRLIKESLARHAEALGQADLLVVGTDHRFTDLARREDVHLSGDRLEAAAGMLRQLLGVHEFMLLCTCNRVELVGLASATPALVGLIRRALGLEPLGAAAYVHQGFDAFRHLALTTAGLLSQVPGETHIRGQIKQALELSRRHGWSAGILHDWVGRALRIGNAIRRATVPLLGRTDIEDRCEAFLVEALGDLRGRRILVIGAGTVGRNVVARLLARGATVACGYRTRAPAFARAAAGRVSAFPLADLQGRLADPDAIVCATAAAAPVLTAKHARALAPGRRLVVVDLGVPRNVAPGFAAGRAGVRVANLDDLKRCDRGASAGVQAARAAGERVVRTHIREYERVRAGIQTGG
jgi:glutamyl-tRNA reductase